MTNKKPSDRALSYLSKLRVSIPEKYPKICSSSEVDTVNQEVVHVGEWLESLYLRIRQLQHEVDAKTSQIKQLHEKLYDQENTNS